MNGAAEELTLWTANARAQGIAGAERTDGEWIEGRVRWVASLPEGEAVNADGVHDSTYNEPSSPGSVGALFTRLNALGLIEHDGFMRSRRIRRHGGLQSTWRRTAVPYVSPE
ncbi:MAG: hypothetical protein WD206_07260 [Actinomycetota bacterium]